MSEDSERIKRKNLLLSYYNQETSNLGAGGDSIQNNKTTVSSSSIAMSNLTNSSYASNDSQANAIQIHLKDPYDINSTTFEPDLFLRKLIKEKLLAK